MIDQILRKIPEKKRKKMNYVHLGGIQILVKSTFKEGINCPIVINLSDERFINAREGNLGIVKGNLAYTKLLFTYYPKYCISLKDADFNNALSLHFQIKRKDLFKPGNHIMSIYYQALYTVTNSNYGKIYKNKGMIEIDQECSGIARIIEAEVQQAQISDEYEIQFGKTQEIGSTSNPRLSIEYGRNSIKKTVSNRYSIKNIEPSNITKIKGRIFNGSEWKNQEILIQTGATANHIKGILIEGIQIYEGKQYTYQTFEDNGSEASLAKSFLIKDWDTNKNNISMIGITGDKEKLFKSKEKISFPETSNMDNQTKILTHINSNSNAKGISIDKVAGDVPLAFNAQNISKENGREEEEYLSFTRYIYNLPEESGETYGVLGTTSLFPRISIFPNGLPNFTAQLFEFGYLDRVYTKPDLKELSQLPSKLFEAVKNYAQGNGVYCRFFSISMECKDTQAYYPTLNYITIEKIKDFNVKATGVNNKWAQMRSNFSANKVVGN
ncbi:hypothetical protein H5410_026153 [Solanum commersonii]|uniref:Uncharacterized protein n=1 Tax=Solanum commersonii TaxID=4109 RepID=A0A9J5YXV5_SOLCO|nr:hypothetical protein H5410_026153 [Solanum commersonii]